MTKRCVEMCSPSLRQSLDLFMMTAVCAGDAEKVKAMLDAGVGLGNINDLALWAARQGQRAILELLISNGANAEACGDDGMSLLHEAAQAGHFDVVKFLVNDKGVDPLSKDGKGRPPAALSAHVPCITFLAEAASTFSTKPA